MSIPVVSEHRVPLGLWTGALARVSVGIARLLVMLPPGRLRRVLAVLSRGSRPATERQAAYARQAAVTVSVRCAGLGCLQRSVAAAVMCRLQGAWPDWCSGFRTEPFGAHAWVEVDGRPVGEPADMSRFRTVIAVRHPRSVPQPAAAPHPPRRNA